MESKGNLKTIQPKESGGTKKLTSLQKFVKKIGVPAAWNDGIELNLNKEALKLLGIDKTTIPTIKEWFNFMFHEKAEAIYNDVYLINRQKNFPDSVEYPLRAADGSIKYVYFSAYIANNEEVWLMHPIEKVQEKKKEPIEEELAAALIEINRLENKYVEENKKLKKSNRELEDFAYVASHDLKEPLRKIVAFSERLREKYKDKLDEKAQFYIERMENASSRMQTLIDDLLKYSRVSRTTIEVEPLELHEVFEIVVDKLELLIERNQAQLNIENVIDFHGNKNLIVSLFQNLINNAIKFQPKGQRAVVTINSKMDKVRNKKFVHYTVTDNGIGMEKKYLKRIFHIFERLHGKEDYSGTGIGLAISQRIVEKHSGKISVESELGKGTTFHIYMPYKKQ